MKELDEDDDKIDDNAVKIEDLANEEPDFTYTYYGNKYELAIMGFTTVVGGQLYGWNSAFSCGFGSYLIAQLLVGVAYIVMLATLAELSSTLQFPGGTYSCARAVLGFYLGFIIGSLECLEYIFMSTASVVYIGEMFVQFTGCSDNYQPALWFIFYGFTAFTTMVDARIFWATSNAIGVVAMVLLLIYCFGSLKYVDLAANGPYFNNTATYVNASSVGLRANLSDDGLFATRHVKSSGVNYTQVLWTPPLPANTQDPSYWFVGGMTGWMGSLGYATWGFAGIESLTLLTSMVKDPQETVPFGCLWGCVTLFVTCIFILFVCASMPPGLFTTAGIETFMSTSYMLMWPQMSYTATVGRWLSSKYRTVHTSRFPIFSSISSLLSADFAGSNRHGMGVRGSHRQAAPVARCLQPAAVDVHASWRPVPSTRRLCGLPDRLRDLPDRLLPALVQHGTAEHRHILWHVVLLQYLFHILQAADDLLVVAAQVSFTLWHDWSCLRQHCVRTSPHLCDVLSRIGRHGYDIGCYDCHHRHAVSVLFLLRQGQTGNPTVTHTHC